MTFKWEKLGRVFPEPGFVPPWWMREFAQAPATLVFDDFVRVYFSCRPHPDADGQYVSYTGFADLDRKDLTRVLRVSYKPIMELGALGTFDEHGTYPVSVLRCGDHVRCYYAGWSRKVSTRFDTAIGLATSVDDGATFQREGATGPVLGASIFEPFVLSGPKIRKFNNRYFLFYIAGREWKMIDGRSEPVYKIRGATSSNGVGWARMERDLIANKLGADEVQSGPDVHFADGLYHMFFCYRPVGHHPGKEGGLRIGYASSTDLHHWTRDDSQAGIDVSPEPGAWDSEMVRYPHVLQLDGETYLFYNGNEFGRWGFGLAVKE
jgi:hypothetical protein